MSINSDDYEFDIDLVDDLESGSVKYRSAISPSEYNPQIDRRSHHNLLERKRRDLIKESFIALRDAIPSMRGQRISRSQILKRAAEYIQSSQKRICTKSKEYQSSKKQNHIIFEKVRQLQESDDSDSDVNTVVKIEPMSNDEDEITSYDNIDDEYTD